MDEPALPFDILLAIMEVSSSPCRLRMSMTCRVLRGAGARYLLEGGVALSSTEHIISFAKFALADGGGRVRHLRCLEIFAGGISPRGLHALRGLIAHPSLQLESLALLDAEAILTSDSDACDGNGDDGDSLFHAFASLTTLKHLTMDRTDVRSFDLIRSLSSSLVTASLRLEHFNTWSPPTDPDERNPILLLIRSSSTLKELSGNGFEVDPRVIKYDVVYPLVRRLTMGYSGPREPGIMVYINAFPNLEYLSLQVPPEAAEEQPFLHPLLSRRPRNLSDQLIYNCTWTHLKEVSGTAVDLYELGLRVISHIPTLRVLDLISTSNGECLPVVVSSLRPTHLIVSMAGTNVLGENSMLSRVLRQSDQLRRLELEVRLLPDEDEIGLNIIMDAIRASLAPFSSLRALVLTLNHHPALFKNRNRSQFRGGASLLAQELRDMALRAAERRLQAALTFLTEVSVVTSGTHDLDDDTSSISSGEGQNEVTEDFARFMIEDDDEGW